MSTTLCWYHINDANNFILSRYAFIESVLIRDQKVLSSHYLLDTFTGILNTLLNSDT